MQPIIELWHDFRTLILIAAVISLTLLQLWTRSQSQKALPLISSSPSTKSDVAVSQETLPLKASPSPPLGLSARANRSFPKRIIGSKPAKHSTTLVPSSGPHIIQPVIFYCSLSGSTEKNASLLAETYSAALNAADSKLVLTPLLLDVSYVDYDDYFTTVPKSQSQGEFSVKYFYILLLPSYNIDTAITNFLTHLEETHHDFRVDTAPLSDLAGYAVFGIGDRTTWPTEQQGFCFQAVEADKWLARLTGRRRAYPLGMADITAEGSQTLEIWFSGVQTVIKDLADGKGLGEGVPGSGDAVESDDEVDEQEEKPTKSSTKSLRKNAAVIDDLETVALPLLKNTADPLPVDFTSTGKSYTSPPVSPKEMVPKSSPTYNALTKQGYTIVGSHSGVKICRWTKSALRGRGSCYKFSFYGIKSHLCMETTPSLSCSNKCVFCWRHGTNPVGTTWRWQVDPPDLIFEGVKKGHYAKIKMLRGVPGVRAERFQEAMRIRHCALSLVGEPIFYPHINEFTAMLHKERISSFLVCNAQHPDQLAALQRVTQLYVSIDASNRESLRKIDRPLHRDFWERFCRCLDILREKRFIHRTVFRLTLVKGFNIEDEVEGYADLVARGLPCFVEIKGVTYCGTSSSAGAGLTMRNVPFYEEVCEFALALDAALQRKGLEYGIAAEHAHSCCILIASKRFVSSDGRWRTVIDYERFFNLLESGAEFTPEDYTAETLEWALWGNGGFDPADERFKRKTKKDSTAIT